MEAQAWRALRALRFGAAPALRLVRYLLASLAVSLAVAFALECTVFNYPFWATHAAGPTLEYADASVAASADGLTIELDNVELCSIGVDIALDAGEVAKVSYRLWDSGHSVDSYGLPALTLYASGEHVTPVAAYGYAKGLQVRVTTVSGNPCEVRSVSVNRPIPFEVSRLRIALVVCAVLLWAAIRPASVLWSVSYASSPTLAGAAALTLLVVALRAVALLSASSFGDVGAPGYHAAANDEYTELARSLAKGSLHLEEEPPDWLVSMDGLDAPTRLTGSNNVMDPSARGVLARQTGEPYKIDTAYYDGHYYVYFGVVPVLALYLPYHLLTGADLANSAACRAALRLLLAVSTLLVFELYRRRYPAAPVATLVLALCGLFSLSSVVYSMAAPSLYNVPVLFALMFGALALYLSVRSVYAQGQCGRVASLAGSSLAVSLVAGCRPQLLVLAAPCVLVAARLALRETSRRARAAVAASFALPMAVVAAGIMWYNAARFSGPLDFGASYNLPGNNDMTLRGLHPVRAAEGLLCYLLKFPRITLAFPYLQQSGLDATFLGLRVSEPIPCGLLWAAPCGWVALASLWRSWRRSPEWLAAAGGLAFAGIIAAFDAEAAGVLGRYEQDFGMIVGLGFVLATLGWAPDARGWSTTSRWALASLVLASVVMCALLRLCLMMPGGYSSGATASPEHLDQLQRILSFWLF